MRELNAACNLRELRLGEVHVPVTSASGLLTKLDYVAFALRGGESIFWVVAEVVRVAIFGAMGSVGLFCSKWWVVAGWALHPLWEVGLHFLGPGRSFAPETYTIACFSSEQLVAAYTTITCGVVQLRGHTLAAAVGPPNARRLESRRRKTGGLGTQG